MGSKQHDNSSDWFLPEEFTRGPVDREMIHREGTGRLQVEQVTWSTLRGHDGGRKVRRPGYFDLLPVIPAVVARVRASEPRALRLF